MVESDELAQIMQLRALGWSHREIADKVGVSEATVGYKLRKMRDKSLKEGVNVFWEIMAAAGVRWMNRKMGLLEKLG